ncbi:MAG TPA: SBBP repeat-containing protein, partial [Alphaproteobacteria bacterium]|nr:SBBP repeat-containing protein [Alphaproteobacteria bacterium]
FDSEGQELWTRQSSPYADDGALAVTTDASGNVFVAGYAGSAMDASASYGGSTDGYVRKLDSDGNIVWTQQFGGSGADRATAIAVDGSGNVYVGGENSGNAVVRKYTDNGSSATQVWEGVAGSLNSGDAVSGLALGSNGAVYLAGTTSNGSFNGSIAQAHSGGTDGFVSKLTDAGSSASVDFTSYLGSSGTDSIKGIAVKPSSGADEIYVTGATDGALDGGAASVQDFYAAKLDATGTTAWVQQYHGAFAHSGNAITYDADGTSVLSRLGLPAGSIPHAETTELTSLTSARAGQYFSISVNGEPPRRVEIEADDSLGFLSFKMKKILGSYGKVEVTDGIDSRSFSIQAKNGASIQFIAGPEGRDALAALGLSEKTLYGDPAEGEEDASQIYELGLFDKLSVADSAGATDTGVIIDNALRELRSMYKDLTDTSSDSDKTTGLQPVSAEDAAKLADLRRTLSVVTGIAQQGQSSASSGDSSLLNVLA